MTQAYFKKNLARNNPKTQVSGFGSFTSLLGLSNLAPLVPLIILPRRHLVRNTNVWWLLLFLLIQFLLVNTISSDKSGGKWVQFCVLVNFGSGQFCLKQYFQLCISQLWLDTMMKFILKIYPIHIYILSRNMKFRIANPLLIQIPNLILQLMSQR